MHLLLWMNMSCLISFAWAPPSCIEQDESEIFHENKCIYRAIDLATIHFPSLRFRPLEIHEKQSP